MSYEKERAEALLRRAEELVEESRKTDYRMNIVIPFIPTILSVIGAIILFIGLFTLFIEFQVGISMLGTGFAIIIIGFIINLYVIYKWVERRNEHFRRTLSLFETIAELAEVLKFRRSYAIKSRLNEFREVNSRMRSALANAILTIVPFYVYYVYHFLNKDFVSHSEKEKLLLIEIFDELRERLPGFTRRVEEFVTVPDRSTFLYIILTLVTGFFTLYWVYTLTKDPNKHFESHGIIERELIAAFREILTKL